MTIVAKTTNSLREVNFSTKQTGSICYLLFYTNKKGLKHLLLVVAVALEIPISIALQKCFCFHPLCECNRFYEATLLRVDLLALSIFFNNEPPECSASL